MSLKDVKYKYNQSIVKVYGFGDNKKIKVITMNCLRTAGVVDDNDCFVPRGSVNDEKLDVNIIRAKEKIFELAFCNPWQYFFTGTIDGSKYDRTDLNKYHKDLTQWLTNQSKKIGHKIDYLFIPELHADGKSWHIHGFINGLSDADLKRFVLGDKMGLALADKVKSGDVVYNWLAYQKKFGFCDLEPVRNAEAVSKYITKYINKSLFTSVKDLNAHLYYHSRGLRTAEVIKKGSMSANIEPSYKNDYCSVSWLDFSEEALQELLQSFVAIDYYKTRKDKSQAVSFLPGRDF